MSELKRFPASDNQTTFGMHFMLDAYDANPKELADMKHIFKFLYDLPNLVGMNRLGLPIVVNADETASGFDPGGITGFTLISESHISIHTFPKRSFFTMDLYSCSNFEDQIETILRYVSDMFHFQDKELQVVLRGKRYSIVDKPSIL